MLFPTLEFGLFFLVVFAVSWEMRQRPGGRKLFLIAASYLFYSWWDWRFTGLLALSSVVNYAAGRSLGALHGGRARRFVLTLAVLFNLGLLGFFKYYGFFLESLDEVLHLVGLERDLPFLQIILPVGISFFTFQGLSYIVDVYRAKIPPERSLSDVALYISFFPQLVAGPIVRAGAFLPQLKEPARLTREMVGLGVVLILSGLVKKMVIANYLATDLVDPVFFDPSAHGGLDLLVAVYGYAIQIYCDFSGYSDIAIGVAALLGYRFAENFNQPYRASSLQDFWRRWHMSLSSWLRDYLYIPLGGSRGGGSKGSRFATYRNLFLTMFLGGIWHGAAWTFVAWGSLHGGVLVLERLVRERVSGPVLPGFVGRVGGTLLTFHVVCIGWIFFRAQDFATAGQYFIGLFRWSAPSLYVTPFIVGLIGVSLLFHFTPRDLGGWVARGVRWLPSPALGLLAGASLLLIWWVAPPGVAPFIYFQF